MHVRISTRRQGKRLYRYVQLVQSYRRADGMPTCRVIGNLGRLSELEIANLKAALQASREGKRLLAMPRSSLRTTPPPGMIDTPAG